MGIGEWRVDWWTSGLVGWWTGGLVGWWTGGLVGWWTGGLVGWWTGGLVSVTICMYRDSSLALRMTVRMGNPVTLTINCGASRHHNPRAKGPSNLRTRSSQPFYTTCRHQAATTFGP